MKKPSAGPAPVAKTAGPQVIPWPLVFAVLAMLLISLAWFPIARMGAQFELSSNEGFNSYYQQAATSGRVYGEPPLFYYANYGPVSFHAVGWLGRAIGDMKVAGRFVSFLAWLAIGLLTGLTVERLSGSRRAGVWAALCWFIWLAAFDPIRIAFNDPHMLGVALGVAGFYCFVRDPESVKWLRISGVVFAFSLFTKQTLVAFPAAVAIQLFLTNRKRLWLWLATAAGACVVLLALTLVFDGRYFLDHLMLPRTFSFEALGSVTVQYLTFVQIAFVAALYWMVRGTAGTARALVWGFAAAHLVAITAVGGDGAGINHFFDALVLIAMISGLLLPAVEQWIAGAQLSAPLAASALIVPFFLCAFLVLPQRVPFDLDRNRLGTPALTAEWANAVSVVRSLPEPALCENLLLCFEAGKKETVDAFALDQAIKTGHLEEQRIVQLVANLHFKTIELEVAGSETLRPAARHRFTAGFMTQLFANYKLVMRNSRHAVFVAQ